MNPVGCSDTREFDLYLDDTPKVMNIAIQGGLKHISITEKNGKTFLRVETNDNATIRQILLVEVHPTGSLMPDADEVTYLGTAMVGGGIFVWHIFYLIRDIKDQSDEKNSMADDRQMPKSLHTIYKYSFAVNEITMINIDSSTIKPLYAGMQYGEPTLWVLLKLEKDKMIARTSLSIISSANDNVEGYLLLNEMPLDDRVKRNVFYQMRQYPHLPLEIH